MFRIIKDSGVERHDAHIVKNKQFIQDRWGMGGRTEQFSGQNVSFYNRDTGEFWGGGVQKKMWHAAGYGAYIDDGSAGGSSASES